MLNVFHHAFLENFSFSALIVFMGLVAKTLWEMRLDLKRGLHYQ